METTEMTTTTAMATATPRRKKRQCRTITSSASTSTSTEGVSSSPNVTPFDIVNEQLKLAWNSMYDRLFPSGTVALVNRVTAKLSPAPHELAVAAAAATLTTNKELNTTYNSIMHDIYD